MIISANNANYYAERQSPVYLMASIMITINGMACKTLVATSVEDSSATVVNMKLMVLTLWASA